MSAESDRVFDLGGKPVRLLWSAEPTFPAVQLRVMAAMSQCRSHSGVRNLIITDCQFSEHLNRY